MHALKILLVLAAAAALYVYLPAMLVFNPMAVGSCITAVFYLGLVTGELLEFCADRINLYRKL